MWGARPERHGAHLLRFDGKYHHFGALDRARVVGGGLDAVISRQLLQLLLARIGNHHPLVGRPRLVRPPISAAAMLPPPMNASLRILFMPAPLFVY